MSVGRRPKSKAPIELTPDAQQRIPIGKLLSQAGLGRDVRLAVTWEHGRFVMTPMVSVPAAEAWLFKSPTALARVKRGLDELGSGEAGADLGSFSKFAEEG
jgi:hypothetical protein